MIDKPKTCTKCKKPKPKSEFRLLPSQSGKPKYKAQCKDCEKSKKAANSIRCKNCGKEFMPFSSTIRFCSQKCRAEKQPKFKVIIKKPETAKKKPNQVSDKNKALEAKFSRNRAKLKRKVINEHGFLFCQVKGCGKSNVPLETHHIIYRSERPGHKRLHDIVNLILCCADCHANFHNHKESRAELVIERKLHVVFDLQKYL